jgi:hypothetical protein
MDICALRQWVHLPSLSYYGEVSQQHPTDMVSPSMPPQAHDWGEKHVTETKGFSRQKMLATRVEKLHT